MNQVTIKSFRLRLTNAVLAMLIACSCTQATAAQQAVVKQQEASPIVRERRTTSDFSNVRASALGYLKKYAPKEILLGVDIDNTMLAMNQDLGSDQWFNWQAGLQKTNPNSPDLVAKEFPELIEIQGLLFAVSGMHPPEPDLPTMIKELQGLGIQTIVLTSRGPTFRDSTERELSKNGYDFSKNSFPIEERRGTFLPFNPKKPAAHGLSAEIVSKIESRLDEVSYSNGIFLTAGQHKGYMLRSLLARCIAKEGDAQRFKAIEFVDDHQRHTACTQLTRVAR